MTHHRRTEPSILKRLVISLLTLCAIGVLAGFSPMALSSQAAGADTQKAESADNVIYCFYMGVCGSCDYITPLQDEIYKQLGKLLNDKDITIRYYDTFTKAGLNKLEAMSGELGIPRPDYTRTVLIYNGQVYMGEEAIGTELRKSVELAPDAAAEEYSIPDEANLVYFYTLSCGDCDQAARLLDVLAPEANGLSLARVNIATDRGLETINSFFSRYDVPDQDRSVPILFYSDTDYLSGYAKIREHLPKILAEGQAGQIIPLTDLPSSAIPALDLSQLPAVFFAGLLGGINPCSLSMLLFLVSLVTTRKENILPIGIAFILTRVLVYLGLGLALYTLIGLLNSQLFKAMNSVLYVSIGAAAIGLAIANLVDFWNVRQEKYGKVKIQLPRKLRQFNNHFMENILQGHGKLPLLAAVIIAGIVISAGEFLCTGQVYLATILYMLRSAAGISPAVLALFLTYVSAMALPMLVIILMIWRGRRLLDVSEAARRNMPWIKLANALFFLIYAIILFLR